MGTVDKLLNFMKLSDDSDDEYDDYETDEMEEKESKPLFHFGKKETEKSGVEEPITYRDPKKKRFKSSGKVVSMNGQGVEVYVIKPQDFTEAQTAADLLKESRTVVVNLEGVELTIAQRSIDFIGGAVYALNGTLQAISNNIFIAAPDSIEVNGDLRSEIMNENIISPQLR